MRKRIDRRAGIEHALATHAVTDVEEHAEADGDAVGRELLHDLALAVIEDLEVLFRETGNQAARGVGHGGRDGNELDVGFERLAPGENSRTGENGERCRGGEEPGTGGRSGRNHDEASLLQTAHHAVPILALVPRSSFARAVSTRAD